MTMTTYGRLIAISYSLVLQTGYFQDWSLSTWSWKYVFKITLHYLEWSWIDIIFHFFNVGSCYWNYFQLYLSFWENPSPLACIKSAQLIIPWLNQSELLFDEHSRMIKVTILESYNGKVVHGKLSAVQLCNGYSSIPRRFIDNGYNKVQPHFLIFSFCTAKSQK